MWSSWLIRQTWQKPTTVRILSTMILVGNQNYWYTCMISWVREIISIGQNRHEIVCLLDIDVQCILLHFSCTCMHILQWLCNAFEWYTVKYPTKWHNVSKYTHDPLDDWKKKKINLQLTLYFWVVSCKLILLLRLSNRKNLWQSPCPKLRRWKLQIVCTWLQHCCYVLLFPNLHPQG